MASEGQVRYMQHMMQALGINSKRVCLSHRAVGLRGVPLGTDVTEWFAALPSHVAAGYLATLVRFNRARQMARQASGDTLPSRQLPGHADSDRRTRQRMGVGRRHLDSVRTGRASFARR